MTATPEDWELLGLEPEADVSKVRRAYRERKALYNEQTLATYNLFDMDERSAMLARIDTAYENIIGTAPSGVPGALDVATATAEADVPSGPAPDAETDPGLHLRHQRLVQGVSLHHVEAATKVGVAILERIENEDFDALPAAVFVRGHVEQFAREMGIADPVAFAKTYLAKMRGDADED
ncbi:MAG: helix-turn-helix transcriptional regulator [Acidobacteriota bacterium]|nr:helix-turn-helix transcriptional regulator [Acidobacteriota bacterium]